MGKGGERWVLSSFFKPIKNITELIILTERCLPESLLLTLIMSHGTLQCLSIGTPKTINFPFVPNGK